MEICIKSEDIKQEVCDEDASIYLFCDRKNLNCIVEDINRKVDDVVIKTERVDLQIQSDSQQSEFKLESLHDEIHIKDEAIVISNLSNHNVRVENNAAVFTCNISSKQFMEGKKQFNCKICNKKFKCQSKFRSHILIHTKRRRFRCNQKYGHISRQKVRPNEEKKIHHKMCNKEFATTNPLNLNIETDEGEKLFECHLCNKSFLLESSLKRHVIRHTEGKCFQCQICYKKLATKTSLSQHLRIHTGVKPFECEVCSKRFTNSSNVARHRRIHTEEKPFQCDMCNKTFAHQGIFRYHMAKHIKGKKFQCEVCKKEYFTKSNLNLHFRTHTGEKPFECDICNKKFTDSSNLTRHYKIHSEEKPFQCKIVK